ncbi:cytochrome P450 [Dichomitus squalens]|uniref:Cytochrome P450 n=1 Tax=Dichomitus squalens TaxID=114155 RepID=A0A4Q9NT11_9APHY|nr:cytochrome P450 [Dichomitus squalens]TBU58193.1 cytochrome P450 [Dichomitus squalens]
MSRATRTYCSTRGVRRPHLSHYYCRQSAAMEDTQAVLYAVAAVLVAAYVIRWRTNPLNSIPTVGGPSAPILCYLSALNFLLHPRELLTEGYQKFHGSVFKVALIDQWLVVVSGSKLVDEVRRHADEQLSFVEGVEDLIQTRYTLGPEMTSDPYHVDIIKEKLMRTLPVVLPDVIDELTYAVPNYIPANETEWISVNVLKTMLNVVARVSNRVFVGLPVCRNQAYLDIAIAFTIDVIKDRTIINIFPDFVKGFIAGLTTNVKTSTRRAIPHIKPLLDERKAKIEEHGLGEPWEGKPNDMLEWILEQAIPRRCTDEAIVQRILLVNFAAIHTSSNSMTHALFDLAAAPEYIQPLREEIEPIVAAEGWTKAAMGKMWKLDSFLRESQRFNGIGLTSVTRKAMKDVALSDGTVLPKGSLIVTASYPIHHDNTIYENANTFDPFRFSRMREVEGEGMKYQFVNTSLEYVSFGHGKHACPGRFFAANELKAILAYIVVNYDLKIGGDGERPPNICFATNIVPNPKGEILFRKRKATL